MRTAFIALALVALLAAMCMVESHDGEVPVDSSSIEETTTTPQEEFVAPPDLPSEETTFDPYAGHETWCEDLRHPPCADDSECPLARTGAERRCIEPFWYEPQEGEKMGLCIPIYLGRTPKQERNEMNRRRARLFAIVEDRCQLPRWAQRLHDEYGHIDCGRVPGRSPNMRQCIDRSYCDPYKLDAALRVVVKRESDWRMSKAHNLPEDVEASRVSWLKVCRRGLYEGNEHFGKCVFAGERKKRWMAVGDDWERWRTYGYYGQNSNYRVWLIDRKAPPEILCHEIYGTETYLRAMRQAWHKYDKGIDCEDKNGLRYDRELLKNKKQKRDREVDTWPEKTWYTLHRAASSGTLCPRDRSPELEGSKTKRYYYGARMEKVDMDPDEVVTLEMLGIPFSDETIHQDVERLRGDLDERFPVGWVAP